jgi:lysophospholipase L1-like esterase
MHAIDAVDTLKPFMSPNKPVQPVSAQPKARSRVRVWSMRLFVLLLVAIVAGELFCRFKLGLGDPPLVMVDPDIEYLYQPSKTYHRFGNTISFNRWSMRSEDFDERKAPNELRVLVIGDSIVNGGALTDQRNIATEILRNDLADRVKRPVVVGNISAGSWGPANMLAYARKFGLFNADVVVIVLSSHDWDDTPTFEPLASDAPTRKPLCALHEAISRYLPRYLPEALGGPGPEPLEAIFEPEPNDAAVVTSMDALRDLITMASEAGAQVAVAEHLERQETFDQPKPGHARIADVAKSAGANVIQLGPAFEQARRAGEPPYRDHIHPNEVGQRIIAKVLADWIAAIERDGRTAAPPSTSP